MPDEVNLAIRKGCRVRIRRFKPAPLGTYSLAGMQPKISGTFEEYEGEIQHMWGDRPQDPTSILIEIKTETGELVKCSISGIVAIFDPTEGWQEGRVAGFKSL